MNNVITIEAKAPANGLFIHTAKPTPAPRINRISTTSLQKLIRVTFDPPNKAESLAT
jgi:hypothetical protein